MKIKYTYRVISVNKDSKCAEVLYESEGLPSHHVGVRFPFTYETFDEIIKMHAPIFQWSLLLETQEEIDVNACGEILYDDGEEESPEFITKVEVIG